MEHSPEHSPRKRKLHDYGGEDREALESVDSDGDSTQEGEKEAKEEGKEEGKEEEEEVLFGTILTRVVGVGRVQPRTPLRSFRVEVELDREIKEMYVFNVVSNETREQLGFLPPDVARALGPLTLAEHVLYTRGELREVQLNAQLGPADIRLRLHLYGQPRYQELATYTLRTLHYVPHVPTVGPAAAPRPPPPAILNGMSVDEVERGLDALFQVDYHLQPREPHPAIVTQMHPYQKQGLAWLWDRERLQGFGQAHSSGLQAHSSGLQVHSSGAVRSPSFLFWEQTPDGLYKNLITKRTQREAPTAARGGICADEMGLGKTLMMLALVVGTSASAERQTEAELRQLQGKLVIRRNPQTGQVERVQSAVAAREEKQGQIADPTSPTLMSADYSRATLLICPVSVISNWVEQARQHVREGALSVYVYHGTQRIQNSTHLAQHDLILTTYQTLAGEYAETGGDQTGPLYNVAWRRVILDEGHVIRDASRRQAQAVCALTCERHWVLTGTPFQNRLSDLWSLLKFLRISPFEHYDWWKWLILDPLQRSDPKGLRQLQHLLASICLRRRKLDTDAEGKLLIQLPSKTVRTRLVEFSEEDKRAYDALSARGKQQFRSGRTSSAHILETVLRMRQFCDEPSLVPGEWLAGESEQKGEVERIRALLAESGDEVCCMCLQSVRDPQIAPCAHFYCRSCITSYTGTSCPFCAVPLNKSTLLGVIRRVVANGPSAAPSSTTLLSAKLGALVDECKAAAAGADPQWKMVVFSQWTSMLDRVEPVLREQKYPFVRLDGGCAPVHRAAAIQSFRTDPAIRIFLISLKAGGLGLNLTSANRVVLFDPWWNPSQEDQAIDRIHRIGQTKPVEVIRLLVRGTVEERVIELQNRKREMMTAALSGRNSDAMQAERLAELSILFK